MVMILKRKSKVIQDKLADGTVKTLGIVEDDLEKLEEVPVVGKAKATNTILVSSKSLKQLIEEDRKKS